MVSCLHGIPLLTSNYQASSPKVSWASVMINALNLVSIHANDQNSRIHANYASNLVSNDKNVCENAHYR